MRSHGAVLDAKVNTVVNVRWMVNRTVYGSMVLYGSKVKKHSIRWILTLWDNYDTIATRYGAIRLLQCGPT